MTYIVKKVAKYVPILRRGKEGLPRFAVKMVYHAIIYPHFLYCCTIWGGCNGTTIKPLQKLTNKLIKVIGRGIQLLNVPMVRTTSSRHNVSFREPVIWNLVK